MHRGLMAVWLVIVLAACGGGEASLSEFAAEGEQLTRALLTELTALDEEWASREPTVESAHRYWEQRVAARVAFLEGIRELDPPGELEGLHETALDLFSRLADAEEALAARVVAFDTPTDPATWWNTPEGQAAQQVDREAIAICHAAQADFDATQQREVLSDVPWVPSEMRETVRVAFGCPE